MVALYEGTNTLVYFPLDADGLPAGGVAVTPKVFASGYTGAWGVAIDPVTDNIWMIDYDETDDIAMTQIGQVPMSGDIARFKVTKTFSDGSTGDVDVTLTCTTGLPLTQTATISGGDPTGVTFVVTDIEGPVSCEVSETGSPAGYIPVYNEGAGCSWSSAVSEMNTCVISNAARPGTFTVYMEWEVFNEGGDAVDDNTPVTIGCDNKILTSGAVNIPPKWYLEGVLGDGDSLTATVETTAGAASCGATQSITASGVDPSGNCGPRAITAGGSSSCTFSNTVFFEGIPTLSQYGLAILILLTLGLGMVGFRRFA